MMFPLRVFRAFCLFLCRDSQELGVTYVFNNRESMSFHGLGQPSCGGKDSTVKEQLLLVCSLVSEWRRVRVMGAVLGFCSKVFFFFFMQNSAGNRIQVVF